MNLLPSNRRLRTLLIVISFEGGLAIIALLLNLPMERSLLSMLSLSLFDILYGVFAVLPLLIAFYSLMKIKITPFIRIRVILDEILKPLFRESKPVDILIVSLVAGIGEELLFRGIIQTVAMNHLGLIAGVLTASIIFGLLHFITPGYAVIATIAGLYLGLIFILTDNLLISVITHGVYDFVALLFYLKKNDINKQ